MLKSTAAMGAATLTSRVLGMAREVVYANFMGTTWVASAFILAFQVPNLFRRLLGEGALTAAFIPIFKAKEEECPKAMWQAANAVVSGLAAAAGILTLLVVLGLTVALAVGHGTFSAPTELMLRLLRVMFPYTLLVCLAAVFIGMANARGYFFVPALGAVALNVIMIASVFFLAPHMGVRLDQRVFALAIGVLAAGVAQALFQWPLLRREGWQFAWVNPWHDPTVHEVVRKMIPGSIGVAAFQINVLLTQSFSYWFDERVVSTFSYAVRLMELPQGMFGISLATYLLPTLSGIAARKDYPEFRRTLGAGLAQLAFANLAAAAVCLALAEPIVRLLFERGKFDATSTTRVAHALLCLAPGLLMFSMNNILARAFYALKDIRTPMWISVFCLGLNLVVAFWLVRHFEEARVGGEVGLGIANTFSGACNTVLLLYSLRRKLHHLDLLPLRNDLLALLAAAVLAGGAAYYAAAAWTARFGHATLHAKLGEVFLPLTIAALVYGAVAFGLKVPAAREVVDLVMKKLRRSRA